MKKIDRREFLQWTGGSVAGLSLGHRVWAADEQGASPRRPPNFVVIMADDIGAKELSCYGQTKFHTPNLDRLAETGVKFETCYAAPICHPSRLMLMTGQYGCHNGVYNFAGRRGGPEPDSPVEDIARSHVTFANLLKKRGYATALAGKWQLSGEQPHLIKECDFDEYCIWAYEHNLPGGVKHTGGYEGARKPSRYWHPSIVKNGEYVPTTLDDYGPDIHHAFAADFMARHKDEPFLLYYPMCLTHGPHMPTPDTLKPGQDRFQDGKQNFPAVVEYLDTLVGRLVAELDRLGLRENTILFFTGDNGTGGEGKGAPTELGARVPMIVNGPGLVKPRGSSMELTDLSDVVPTLCDFAGAPLPEGRVIDGISLAPYLRGDSEQTRDWIFSFIGDRRILRTKRWLLEDNSPLHYGRLYNCGEARDGAGYREVTNSDDPEALAAKDRFNQLLAKLPAPILPEEGEASAQKPERAERKDRRVKSESKH
jgi:arylsulfatase A